MSRMLQALRNLEAKNPARDESQEASRVPPDRRAAPTTIATIVLDNPILRALHTFSVNSQSDSTAEAPLVDSREADRRQTETPLAELPHPDRRLSDRRQSRPVETSTDHGDYQEHTVSSETVMLHDPLVAHDFTANAWTEYLRSGDNPPNFEDDERVLAEENSPVAERVAPPVVEAATAIAPRPEVVPVRPAEVRLPVTPDLETRERSHSLPNSRREATALERAVRKNLSDAVRAAPYRQLAERLTREIRPGNGNCLLFTGVGSQSTADEMLAHAGFALAEAGDEILLVDGDFARGGLSKGLGNANSPGLAEVVSQRRDWREMLVATATEHLYLLPAGQLGLANPAAAADELAKVLEQAERQFRLVLVDGGAAGDLVSQALGRLCDATYFVIRLGSTDAPEAQNALERYRSLGARVLGCVATNVPAK